MPPGTVRPTTFVPILTGVWLPLPAPINDAPATKDSGSGVAAGTVGGGGLMALGGQLMELGLDMSQIQTVGREVFAYTREVAGDDVVGEIAGAIPGLSQFI